MIRDPRDRYEARLVRGSHKAGIRRWGKTGIAAASWLYSAGLAIRNQKMYPDRYKVVSFERMVSQPEETLRDVCSFLDEMYDPAMLMLEGIPRFQKVSASQAKPVESPLSVEYIGRYHKLVSKKDIAFIQMVSRQDMLAHSYPLEPIRLALVERIHFYAIDCPVNLLSMSFRYIIESMPHYIPISAK